MEVENLHFWDHDDFGLLVIFKRKKIHTGESYHGRLQYQPIKLLFASPALGRSSWRQITWSTGNPISWESTCLITPSLGRLSRPIELTEITRSDVTKSVLSQSPNKQQLSQTVQKSAVVMPRETDKKKKNIYYELDIID